MFTRIISLPSLFAFAKRHSLIKKIGKVVWQGLSSFWIVVGHIGKTKVSFPPTQHYFTSSVEWAQNQYGLPGNQVSFTKIHGSEKTQHKLPGTVENIVHWKYRRNQIKEFPETFLLNIPNGRVAKEGYVITNKNELLGDVSKIIRDAKHINDYDDHPAINTSLPPARYINGKVATISFPFAGTNYYHWMFDLLPRIYLLELAGWSISEIDFIYINDRVSHFQRETLSYLGIDKNRVIESQWYPHIQAKKLIVPSLVGQTGKVPVWACNWLREKFWPAQLPSPHRRLYINRRKVSYRKVKNEMEIERFLESYGFESIAPEKSTVIEQAKMFAEAEIVIAPHGAGLTNIVFCQEGAKVIELLHHSAVNEMYWTICNAAKLDYNYIISAGERPNEGVDEYKNFVDISFHIDEIQLMLAQLGIEPSRSIIG